MGFEYEIRCEAAEIRMEDLDFSYLDSEWKVVSNDGKKVRFSLPDSIDDGWGDAILIKESSSFYLLVNVGHRRESFVKLIESFLKRQGIHEFLTEEI